MRGNGRRFDACTGNKGWYTNCYDTGSSINFYFPPYIQDIAKPMATTKIKILKHKSVPFSYSPRSSITDGIGM